MKNLLATVLAIFSLYNSKSQDLFSEKTNAFTVKGS